MENEIEIESKEIECKHTSEVLLLRDILRWRKAEIESDIEREFEINYIYETN